MAKRIELYFPSADKLSWLRNISNYSFVDYEQGSELIMLFHKIQDIESLTPIHIVTLACFIDNLDRKGVKVKIKKDNEVASFLCNEVKLSEYWAGGKNYVPASRDSIFNLWRIIDNQKEVYSRLIHDYLKKEFFHNKDLGAVKNSIDYEYNNGLAEGSVNKIKLAKRIMYGRSGFQLLKAKILLNEYYKFN